MKHAAIFASLSLLLACSDGHSKDKSSKHCNKAASSTDVSPKDQDAPGAKPIQCSLEELTKIHGWKLPTNQACADVLPPQPGSKVLGKTVKGGLGCDTNWTAFTIVLFAKASGEYEILTQKRAITPVGVLEAPGGHLTGGQSWRQGAADELYQETGIKADSAKIFFLEGGTPGVDARGNLFGNMNFVTVLKDKKPTTKCCSEIDATYGHIWLNLLSVYNEAINGRREKGTKDGKYFRFFRNHVINFCETVLCWQQN